MSNGSAMELTEGCFKYPLVEQYLKIKQFSRGLVVKYVVCRVVTLITLLLACLYLGYYISLASVTDEFACNIRTGILRNRTDMPPAVQCKLVAVGIFRLLSYINMAVYAMLAPLVIYAVVGPARQDARFLRPYELLPAFGAMNMTTPIYNDLSIYLLFLEENLSELKSYKCLQVLELLRESGGEAFDTMCLLRTLGQVKTDMVDGKRAANAGNEEAMDQKEVGKDIELIDVSSNLVDGKFKQDQTSCGVKDVRQRMI